jgi:hypothetical protein
VTLNELLQLFEEIWIADFEFIPKPGGRPDVVCLCARELRTGRTLRLWRNQLGAKPPYRTDASVLFICFVANAELSCHLALDWPLPAKILDLSPEFRCAVNGRITPEGKGLLGALAYYGLDSIGTKHKDAMRKRILQGWPVTAEEIELILAYCLSDVYALADLLPKLLPGIDLPIALYRGEFIAVSAAMEHRGVPIDMEIFTPLANKRTWAALRDAMVPVIDAQYGVYAKKKNGEWSFSRELFEAYLNRQAIAWPRLETGALNLRRKTFETMSKSRPELEDLRQLRHARDKMRCIKLAVDSGRNRTVLWPFQSKTSRTQPKASQWIFSPAVWLRSLIKPEPGRAVAYIDYSSMEFMLAAALSGDPVMLDLYSAGDPYLGFAKRVGTAPQSASKATHAGLRDRYKVALLAIQYGMMAEMLSARLGISSFEGHEMLAQHRALFNVYWRWSEDWVAQALDSGTMRTVFGWECRTGITEFNERSIRNWPVQATGAEILRVACIIAHRHGIELCGPVHDAVLIEAPIERIEDDAELMREIMRRAARAVLDCELRTDKTVVKYPNRYSDPRGEQIWQQMMKLLADYERRQEAGGRQVG